ncbi:MAG TPA: MYXO-CTERM sorting domain-containing protein [Kofleriaceae bacterium]|nr:MYXO-CTERM sorting domain-containing protein [Kofleriaceae bacterium]
MRACHGVIAVLFASNAHAVAPRSGPRVAADTLTALPAAGVAQPLRLEPTLRWDQASPPPGWTTFVAAAGGTWHAAWDAATGVPSRIWGTGIAVPGSIASPAIAEAFARAMLAAHVALLAPGAAPSDFTMVSDVYDGDIRAIGFVQHAGGLAVVGGQVSFQFKRDRLFVIGSQALPDVPAIAAGRARAVVSARALPLLRAAVALPDAPVTSLGDDVILPLVGDAAVLGYRRVAPMQIDGGAQGRYLAYADATTGAIIAIHQVNEYVSSGTLDYHTPDRYPGRGYLDHPAPRAYITIAGAQQTTSQAGGVTWPTDGSASIIPGVTGDLVTVVNQDMMEVATANLSVAPGGTALWDASSVVEDDAQLDAYIDTNLVKEFVRDNIDPAMPTLDDQMTVNVNLAMTCNAFFDGSALNFFEASPAGTCSTRDGTCCDNTARVQDVNFHEYGHRVHTAEIIPGVGAFDGAMSEGAADTLAVTITNDSGMGRGFFYSDEPLRELDPPGREWMWPIDVQPDIHHTGLIYGGTMWDLKTTLFDEYGEAQGLVVFEKIYVGTLRRSTDIPTSLIEALASDDDDGNLANGTPHECEIRNAYGRHGLRTALGGVEAPGALADTAAAIGVVIEVTGLSACSGDTTTSSATLAWRPPFTGVPSAGSVDASAAGANRWFADLPLAPQQSVYYQASVAFADGSSLDLPDNIADPWYQLYDGPTVALYCTDFETDPFAAGWTTGTLDGSPSPWAWAMPGGGATDPHAAYSGAYALIQAPGGDYPPSQTSWVKSPEIDVGKYSDVRVQYRRWLAVQDGAFDQARVTANDTKAWQNATAPNAGDAAQYSHVDKEWRFHDVPLSGYFIGRTLQVGWDLTSDAGLQLGGWALDDVCIVANPFSICGDGVKTATEQCDNGSANADAPDACRSDCRLPICGDHIVDTGEQCDDGPSGSTSCGATCTLNAPSSSGCCSSSGTPASLVLALATFGLVRRRRRR